MLIFGIMLEFYIFRYKLRSRRDDSSGRERMENLRFSWSLPLIMRPFSFVLQILILSCHIQPWGWPCETGYLIINEAASSRFWFQERMRREIRRELKQEKFANLGLNHPSTLPFRYQHSPSAINFNILHVLFRPWPSKLAGKDCWSTGTWGASKISRSSSSQNVKNDETCCAEA